LRSQERLFYQII